ncbi:Imidazole glycerol phosphate synthase amidotransferase subunit [hydrothermal vent metagenome]|uniref:Imidazole glycerol phosphate synthase amidotransferase subunit n=1 Tax=hydrothermal vent metagenome TaxID=652676 RepID=A0A3B0WCG7_9ZZZZ
MNATMNTTRVGIIDLNSGNLLSMQTAIETAGCELITIQKPSSELLNDLDVLVMPGQGRFAYVMEQIIDSGWHDFLLEWCRNGKRLIGICVGMQVLFEGSDEDPEAVGLGLFPGRCHKLSHPKTPMVGWAKLRNLKLAMSVVGSRSESEQSFNQTNPSSTAGFLAKPKRRAARFDTYAYFVNSFAIPECPFATAKVNYGDEFCAAVQRGNLYGFQFHPEKSGAFGKELIKYVCQ